MTELKSSSRISDIHLSKNNGDVSLLNELAERCYEKYFYNDTFRKQSYSVDRKPNNFDLLHLTENKSRPVTFPDTHNILNVKKRKFDKRCAECRTQDTCQWRTGPDGQASLCNACGLRYRRGKEKKLKIQHSSYVTKLNIRPQKEMISTQPKASKSTKFDLNYILN